MFTSTPLPTRLAMSVALLFALSMTACSTSSTLLSPERTDSPLQAPTVDCKKGATPPIAAAPCADCWVSVVDGVAQLSQQAVTWIVELAGIVDKERALRGEEHRCLDEHEKKGVIKQ